MNKYNSIILAAGKGTRMNSNLPKVLHKILDKTLIECVLSTLDNAGIKEKIVVVGNQKEKVIESLAKEKIIFAEQEKQLGTGDAVKSAIKYIKDNENYLILYGDMPLISSNTIKNFINYYETNNLSACIITATLDNPYGYGRIIYNNNSFAKIVEEKDATEIEKEIKESNVGVYLFNGKLLKKTLNKLTNKNKQHEYYLTDTLEICKKLGETIGIYKMPNTNEFTNVNTRKELEKATTIYLDNILDKHFVNGVTIVSKNNTYISSDVSIGKDTVIYPGTILEGKTVIGDNCIIGPNTTVINSSIGNNVNIEYSKVTDSKVLDNCKIGPFTHIRPNNNIGKNSKLGAFVEVKNSSFGENTKASHLLYVGDSKVGDNVEFGCGVITVNCDTNFNKHKTTIKDNAFIGCNSTLIAPVTINKNAIVAAGSTITKDVEKNSLAIARERQINKKDYITKKE